jgi:hypothetical protein
MNQLYQHTISAHRFPSVTATATAPFLLVPVVTHTLLRSPTLPEVLQYLQNIALTLSHYYTTVLIIMLSFSIIKLLLAMITMTTVMLSTHASLRTDSHTTGTAEEGQEHAARQLKSPMKEKDMYNGPVGYSQNHPLAILKGKIIESSTGAGGGVCSDSMCVGRADALLEGGKGGVTNVTVSGITGLSWMFLCTSGDRIELSSPSCTCKDPPTGGKCSLGSSLLIPIDVAQDRIDILGSAIYTNFITMLSDGGMIGSAANVSKKFSPTFCRSGTGIVTVKCGMAPMAPVPVTP